MKDKANFVSCLAKVPIFSNLNRKEQERIVDLIQIKHIDKNEFIYHAGNIQKSLFIVHNGKVKILRYTLQGSEQVVRVINEGDFFGENFLFQSNKMENFAQALEQVQLCVIDGDQLNNFLLQNPDVMFNVMSELSKRLANAESIIEQISLTPVGNRIAKSILSFAKNNKIFTLPISKSDWASSLGMSKETLSRKLSEFKDEKIINLYGQREVEVLNYKKLEEYTTNSN